MEKKTPLYQTHVDMGGKIVEFGGFLMPVQYPTGVIAEHMAVREKAGLFDVSHMGELRLKGPDAVANVQKIITADISNMKDGEIKYSMFCNDNGGIIDDFIVYRCAADDYWRRRLPRRGQRLGPDRPAGPQVRRHSQKALRRAVYPRQVLHLHRRRAPEPRRAHDPCSRLPDGLHR